MAETYYERLGVAADASVEEIERAYRERLKETHPDVSDDPDAGDRTRALIEARDVLADETERARYDRLGHDRYVQYHDSVVEPGAEDVDDANPTAATANRDTAGAKAGGASRRRANDTASTTRTTETGGTAGDWNTGRETGGSTSESTSTGGATGTDRARRHAQNEQTRAAWNTTGQQRTGDAAGHTTGESYAREWHAWNTGSAHRVHPTDTSTLGNRLFPPGPSLIVIATAFGCYPVLLWAAVTPMFPLSINLVVGLCLLGLLAFLQSMPTVGVVVFGTWALLLPTGLTVGLGLPVGSPAVGLAVGGTVLPFGLSLLTWWVLRR